MKVFYGVEELNPDSTEMKKLYIKDKYIGDYSYGLYSKLQSLLITCDSCQKSSLRVITGMNTYMNGVIYYELGINTKDYDTAKEIVSAIEEISGKKINDWIEIILKEKIKEAEKEIKERNLL